MTFFETLQKSFVDVPVDAANDNAIHTSQFLDAAESLTTLFGTSSCLAAAAALLPLSLSNSLTSAAEQMSWAPLPSSPSSRT